MWSEPFRMSHLLGAGKEVGSELYGLGLYLCDSRLEASSLTFLASAS